MTDLKGFQYVLSLAESLNFSRAAAKLKISQSTLSQHIMKIEKELGVELFERSASSVSLTQYGKIYINGARRIMDTYSEILDSISDADSGMGGSVSFGISPTRAPFLLPLAMKQFREEYPEVVVNVKENKSDDILKMLFEGEIDFAYTVIQSREGLSDYEVVYISDDEVMLAGKKSSELKELSHEGVLDFKTIQNYTFVALHDDQLLTDSFNKLCGKSSVKAKTLFYLSELSTAIALVKEGMGLMLLPSSYRKYGTLGEELDFYKILQKTEKRKLALIYKKGKYLSKPQKRLIEIFSEGECK